MSLTTSENGSVTMEKARHDVCLQAAWELDAIATMLSDAVENTDQDAFASMLRVRCLAGRVRELANALMAGLYDPEVTVKELNLTVLLCHEVAS